MLPRRRISPSRGAAAPSRHRRASPSREEVLGGFFFDVEAVRTAMLRAGSSGAATRNNMLGDERGARRLFKTGGNRSRS